MPGQAESDDVRWGLGAAALGFAVANVIAILFTPAGYWLTGEPSTTPLSEAPLSTVALIQAVYAGSMLVAAIAVSRYRGRGPILDFGISLRWFDVPLGVVLGVATQYGASLLYVPLIRWTSVTSEQLEKPARQLTDRAHGSGVLLLFVVVAVLAPIVEEIFFRGLVLRSLERRMSTNWAIVVSAALFGAAHLEPLQFPALFVFGLVAAVLATRTGRLGPGIWAHVAFNAVAVVNLVY
ncbi:MAG: protease family protein [Acidimicrobiaceae bacterium]|jgi:membrane protease YdiL (CAAX protease family)